MAGRLEISSSCNAVVVGVNCEGRSDESQSDGFDPFSTAQRLLVNRPRVV